ncbi:MAG: hypothetical protein ACD_60C00119G0023 [uncultured bacterium]|nr:MAG: hypothetical protein ACD_60C00119G0023 [uncultured bacterium]
MQDNRHYTVWDGICLQIDEALRAFLGEPKTTERIYPAKDKQEADLTQKERQHAAALMRVNHAGEVCAQALYHGQALGSHSAHIKETMKRAAMEEGDHLAWCKIRLNELQSHASYLNPFWYAGSFTIGLVAGWIGDEWSLGFLAETESQVVKHLERHLTLFPIEDQKSISILQQMQKDEAKHRDHAFAEGAKILPPIVKKMMTLASRVMVKTAYWI